MLTDNCSERESFVSDFGNESEAVEQEGKEGISFYAYTVKNCGPDSLQNFSSQVDLRTIRVICLLGEGSFAKVFLVKKEEESGKSAYYAMKVLDKSILKEKDYFNYIKLER